MCAPTPGKRSAAHFRRHGRLGPAGHFVPLTRLSPCGREGRCAPVAGQYVVRHPAISEGPPMNLGPVALLQPPGKASPTDPRRVRSGRHAVGHQGPITALDYTPSDPTAGNFPSSRRNSVVGRGVPGTVRAVPENVRAPISPREAPYSSSKFATSQIFTVLSPQPTASREPSGSKATPEKLRPRSFLNRRSVLPVSASLSSSSAHAPPVHARYFPSSR